MTDRNPAEILYPNPQATKDWKIELRYSPIFHRGHAFLALVDDRGETARELHGLARSKHTGQLVPMGMDDADLEVEDYERKPGADRGRLNGKISDIATVASGSKDEMEKTWSRGAQAGAAINAKKFDYKAHDLSYELGTNGGQIQNSNSVAFTLGKAMGLDLSRALQDKGMTRTFSGWDRDLLKQNTTNSTYKSGYLLGMIVFDHEGEHAECHLPSFPASSCGLASHDRRLRLQAVVRGALRLVGRAWIHIRRPSRIGCLLQGASKCLDRRRRNGIVPRRGAQVVRQAGDHLEVSLRLLTIARGRLS